MEPKIYNHLQINYAKLTTFRNKLFDILLIKRYYYDKIPNL